MFLFLNLCVCVFMCVGTHVMCIFSAGQRVISGVGPQVTSTFYLREGLSLIWNFSKYTRITCTSHDTWLFT